MPKGHFDEPISSGGSTQPAWRARAIQIAVERGLVGQAMIVGGRTSLLAPGEAITTIRCVSASEPTDRKLEYDERSHSIRCDCKAGTFFYPCGHAGAALLILADPQLAPERRRLPDGRAPGG